MRRLVTVAVLMLLSHPAQATDIFVDVGFDRSAWEAAAGAPLTTDPFDNDIAQADVLDFDSGIQSTAAGLNPTANHVVSEGRFRGTLRTAGSTAPGYLTFTWDFPEPTNAFGADFYSIGGSRQVSVQGTFDSGQEAFDLRTLFGNDGGVDQGFFGLTSTVPFDSITLIALGTIDSNDAFTIDEVRFVPEPDPDAAALTLLTLAGIARVGGLRPSWAHRRRRRHAGTLRPAHARRGRLSRG